MDIKQRKELLKDVDSDPGNRREVLRELKIPRSTFYHWRRVYRGEGDAGLAGTRTRPARIWNKIPAEDVAKVVALARQYPALSSRLLALKITDEEEFSISESSVYRILKEHDLIGLRPLYEMPAAKEWRHKTKRPNELWQCDATNIFVVGWGYYKLIPVEDDYSRKIIAYDVRTGETAYSFADIVQMGIDNVIKEGYMLDASNMPMLYTDNGPGFISSVMAKYLQTQSIKHILGTPYHPQGRGKIERFNRRIKETLCLVVYCSPDELKKAVDSAIRCYNATPHEALKNVSPNDVYAGRKEGILQKRSEKKQLTLERRKKYNLGTKEKTQTAH